MVDAEMPTGSPFWRFSLRFYRRPGVADACIALQDGCGVDVNILLFLLWLATAHRRVPPPTAREICARAAPWREDVVVPLRTLRRKLKNGSSFVDGGAAELFRTRIKAIELESERLQQEALYRLAAGLPTETASTVQAAARANVAACEQAFGRGFAPDAVEALIASLTRLTEGT